MNILLYPFVDQAGTAKYSKIFRKWSKAGKAAMFVDPDDVPHRPLAKLMPGMSHTICVLGHCAAGGHFLRSQQSYDAKQEGEVPGHTLRPNQLIGVFRSLGMYDNVLTRLKCLNCHSGEHFSGFVHEAAYATRLKKAMCDGGYGNVSVVGYVGAMTLLPRPFPEFGVNVTRYAVMKTDEGEKAFRGKDLRYAITGNEEVDQREAERILKAIWEFTGDTGIKLDL